MQAEIRSVVSELNEALQHQFSLTTLPDGTWLAQSKVPLGQFTGVRFWFNVERETITSHPSTNFARLDPGDQHEFTFDRQSGSFNENLQSLTDEEMVRRALEPFLRQLTLVVL